MIRVVRSGATLTLPWLASTFGFAWAYGWVALLCGVSAALTWHWLHEPPDSHTTAAAHVRSPNPLARAGIWRIVMAIGLLCVPQFAVLTFASIFLHDYVHAGLGTITATLVAIQAGAMATRVWSGRWTDRHGNRRAYLRGCTLLAVAAFLLLAAFVQASAASAALMTWVPIVLALAGIAVSAWHGVGYTELAAMAGADRAGTALGMANTVVFFGFFLTPLVLPHWLALTSWPMVWATTAVVALCVWPLFPGPGTSTR